MELLLRLYTWLEIKLIYKYISIPLKQQWSGHSSTVQKIHLFLGAKAPLQIASVSL
jgi:hypothetical protein